MAGTTAEIEVVTTTQTATITSTLPATEQIAVDDVRLVVTHTPSQSVVVVVPQTAVVAAGAAGPAGPAGTGDRHFTWAQSVAAATWTIAHSLGKYPSVSVTDSAGNKVFGGVAYLDANTVQLTFSAAFGGFA
ncbi:MAG: hypothetical protein ACREQ5_16395, partial [Candidatus Dormibacteria bacterium]